MPKSQVAEFWNIPQITYVKKIRITGKKIRAERAMEDGYELLETKLPVLLTVIKELNKPRYPSVLGIMNACMEHEDAIKIWNAGDIQAKSDSIGLQGSATWVTKTFSPDVSRAGKKLTGTPDEIANQLIKELNAKNLIK